MNEPSMMHQAVNKLTILYLINFFDLPLTGSQISQFAIDRGYMDYFSFQQYIAELVDGGYLKSVKSGTNTQYTLTEEGEKTLGYLIKLLPENTIYSVNLYAKQNSKDVRRNFDVTANYFCELNNEYTVKCGVYEDDGRLLMEVSMSVMTKEQAKRICKNWKTNTSRTYRQILNSINGLDSAVVTEANSPCLTSENINVCFTESE